MAGNSNFQTMATVAIDSRTRELADNLSNHNAIMRALKEQGNIKPFSGGNKILQETQYDTPGNAMSYTGGEALNNNAGEFATAAEFGIKQYASSVQLSGLQLAQASGKERMIDLLDAAIDNAEIGLMNKLVNGLYSDGTGNSGKDITGLQAAIDLTPATGVYGGIDPATNAWWQNKAVTGTVITSANVWDKFFNMYSSLSRGIETPDTIICANEHWTALNTFLQSSQRFGEGSNKKAQAGFLSVKFLGADVYFEPNTASGLPSGKSYFITSKYMFLRPYGSMAFKSFGGDPDNKDVTSKFMKWYGNLTVSRRACHGVVSDV